MNLHAEHVFTVAPKAAWAMFTDPDAHVAKFASMGHRDIEVLECEHGAGTFRIKIQRLVEFDVPRFARKIFTPTNTVISIEEWKDDADGTYRGTWTGETAGVPISVTGAALLQPDRETETRYVLDIAIDVKVPIIGGRIADFAQGDAERQVEQELTAGDQWLALHGASHPRLS